jgi:hypothetical protein
MVTGTPAFHPLPFTMIVVPRPPEVGEIVIDAIAGGALVADACTDGVADAVADGVALAVPGRGECDACFGVAGTEKAGVSTGPGVNELASGSPPPGRDDMITAIPTPRTRATTIAKIAIIGEIVGRTSFSSSIATSTSSTLGSTA